VRTGAVESFTPSVFALATAPPEQLAYLRDVTMYIDMSAAPAVGGHVGATFKVSGAYKISATKAWLVTTSGYTIELDADAQTGAITMDGATYPVLEAVPEAAGRRLAEVPMLETLSGRQLAAHHDARRLSFSRALMTSGSFTMMAAAGFGRRRQLADDAEGRQLSFTGALQTSGSFTMMASATFS